MAIAIGPRVFNEPVAVPLLGFASEDDLGKPLLLESLQAESFLNDPDFSLMIPKVQLGHHSVPNDFGPDGTQERPEVGARCSPTLTIEVRRPGCARGWWSERGGDTTTVPGQRPRAGGLRTTIAPWRRDSVRSDSQAWPAVDLRAVQPQTSVLKPPRAIFLQSKGMSLGSHRVARRGSAKIFLAL